MVRDSSEENNKIIEENITCRNFDSMKEFPTREFQDLCHCFCLLTTNASKYWYLSFKHPDLHWFFTSPRISISIRSRVFLIWIMHVRLNSKIPKSLIRIRLATMFGTNQLGKASFVEYRSTIIDMLKFDEFYFLKKGSCDMWNCVGCNPAK